MDPNATSTGRRSIFAFCATMAAIYWLLFAVGQFPWIVPADHNGSLVAAGERAALAAACLFLLSLATVCLAAGFFGRRTFLRIATIILTTCWLAVIPWLFPSAELLEYPWRTVLYVLGLASILLGGWMVARPRREPGGDRAGKRS